MDNRVLSPEVQEFIKNHRTEEISNLALRHSEVGGVPIHDVLDQIKSRDLAKRKIPSWMEAENIYFPPPVSLEQCSSELTAEYKASLLHGKVIADLTGGTGIDSLAFSHVFDKVIYIEQDDHLSELAEHNFQILDRSIEVHHSDAESFLHKKVSLDAIYLDPSRRTSKGKIITLEESQPSPIILWDILKASCSELLIKLSPMISLSDTRLKLEGSYHIHLVSIKNELKEILIHWNKEIRENTYHCVELDSQSSFRYIFDPEEEQNAVSEFSLPQEFIYEPNVALLKAGAFKSLGRRYGLSKLARHTHLYTSEFEESLFPGRIFQLEKVLTMKEAKREVLKANCATRNFPIGAEEMKKKLKIQDGGDKHLYGCTLTDDSHVLLLMNRIK